MVAKPKRKLGGLAEPVFASEPLFIRLCTAFVDNLGLILRTAFIVASLLLVQEFREQSSGGTPAVVDVETQPGLPAEPEVQPLPPSPVVTDRVRHYLNCTYEAYRSEHFADCVDEPSRVYTSPQPDPDDMGGNYRPVAVLLARAD